VFAVNAIKIKSGTAQLFVDDKLIASQHALRRTLRQPQKDNGGCVPVIALDDEYGTCPATLKGPGTILFDKRLRKYIMFASAYARTMPKPNPDRAKLFRFTSSDGIHWTKGDDGRPQRIVFDLNDPKTGKRIYRNIDTVSLHLDQKDTSYPYKGWAFFAGWGGHHSAICYVRSRDGIQWQRAGEIAREGHHTIEQDGRTLSGPGDTSTFHHDPASRRFLASLKFVTGPRDDVNPGNRTRSRTFAFFDRLAEPFNMRRIRRIDLVPPLKQADGDMPWDEYYAASAWRYESLWLGGLKIWHGAGDYPHSAAGCAFLKLIVSRDGLRWKKVACKNDADVPEVWLANGPEGGNNGRNDGGYINMFSQGPLRIGDELILYYGSSSYGKLAPRERAITGGGIFRARLRVDGFVSVDQGTLTTHPLAFEGDDLYLNSCGEVLVEVLEPKGLVLGKRTVTGDSLRHRVSFADRSLGALVPNGLARLRFTLAPGAALYSFTISDRPQASTAYEVVSAVAVANEPACMPGMTRAPNGDIFVVFGTKWEPWPWGGVLKMVVSKDQGKTWSKPRLVYKHEDPRYTIAAANGIQTLSNGDILLPTVFSMTPKRKDVDPKETNPAIIYDGHSPENVRDVRLFRSKDNGVTWTLQPTVFKRVQRAARLLATRNGQLVLPMYEYKPVLQPVYVVSKDLGRTWGPRQYLGVPPGVSETNIIEAADGSWFTMMRGYLAGRPRRTFSTVRSTDQGRTWGTWQWTSVQGKMPDLLVLGSGRILMAVGCEGLTDGSQVHKQKSRTAFVTLFVSDDHGRSWKRDVALRQVASGSTVKPIDSPVMCQLDSGRILVVAQAQDTSKRADPLFGWSAGMSLIANILEPTK
jgi:hypothetical protein